MAYKARLKISNKYFDIVTCEYELRRDVDSTLRPTSVIHGGTINLSVESTDDNFIIESMLNQSRSIDGSIIFTNEDLKIRELSFKKDL